MTEPIHKKEVTLICPICGKSWTEPSLEAFLRKVNKAWRAWEPLPNYIEAILKKQNNLETLKKKLEDKGFLLIFCGDCAQATTAAAIRGILEVG